MSKPWPGRVWLNPPYSVYEIDKWINKLTHELHAGHVQAAIMLVPAYTFTNWFQSAAKAAALICFPLGRLGFVDQSGEESASRGSTVFYFGTAADKFRAEFSEFGFIR